MRLLCLALSGLLLTYSSVIAAVGNDSAAFAAAKRDPFTTSERMYSEQSLRTSLRQGMPGFVPGLTQGQGLPKMRLKGFTTRQNNKATALLDIEGAGVYMVKKGDEIGLHSVGLNTVLKVIDVSSNGVKVQSGQVNQVVIVR